jgi:hypothetical protein
VPKPRPHLQPPPLVLDSNLVSLLKGSIYVGGGFLAILALIGLTFFGWDVGNARSSILAIQKETKELQLEAVATIDKLKAENEKVKAEIDKWQKLGAQLEEEADFYSEVHTSDSAASGSTEKPNGGSPRPESKEVSDRSEPPDVSNSDDEGDIAKWRQFQADNPLTGYRSFLYQPRTKIDLIRDAIRDGKFEWTSMGRVMTKTIHSREEIMDEIRQAPDIKISRGRKSKDFIFKIGEPES